MKRVIFCPANQDGCALYRMYMTHLRYRDSIFALPEMGKGVPATILQMAEVAVVQRQTTRVNLEAAHIIKSHGLKYVYDLDDNLWHIPKYNNAKTYFRDQISGTEKCLAQADHVTVSTEHLAHIVRQKTRGLKITCPITVVENAVDLSLFTRSRLQQKKDEIVVGWAGTNTHSLDLQWCIPPVIEVMRKRKNVVLEFMGAEFPMDNRYLHELGAERFRFRPWAKVEHWPSWCSNLPWDVALAPLLVTSFNASKSSVKMLEAGARKCPCLSSATREYARFAEGSDVLTKRLICVDRDDWRDKLFALVDSVDLRTEVGNAMYERVKERYNMEERVTQWRKVFES